MAEPVVYDGSPIASYLQDSGVDEQALIELSASVAPPPPPRSPSSSSTSSSQRVPGRRQPQPQPQPAPITSTPNTTGRSSRSKPLSRNSGDAYSSSVSPMRSQSVASEAAVGSSDAAKTFAYQVGNTLSTLLTDVFLPLLAILYASLLQSVLGVRPPRLSQPQPESFRRLKPSRRRRSSRSPSAHPNKPSSNADTSFAERFKFVICTSFLLTSSLSISFYDSEPTTQRPAPDPDVTDDDDDEPSVLPPDPIPTNAAGPVTAYDSIPTSPSRSSFRPRNTSPLPRLNKQGRRARNAAVLATALLALLSPSWNQWFKSTLAIACVTWASILLLGLGQLEDSIAFDLSRRPRPDAERFLLDSTPRHGLSSHEKKITKAQAITQARKLVKAAQNYDVAVNKAIGAVQEVELVSRGFKLTYPLPPISRIEASSASAWQPNSSPSRYKTGIFSLNAPLSAGAQSTRLSRSSSTGASAASNRKHAQRPLSLSLSGGRASPSGRESPSLSYESHDGDYARRVGSHDYTPTSSAAVQPRRLAALRQQLIHSLDEVSLRCRDTAIDLEQLADREELNLLKDMYTLDQTLPGNQAELEPNEPWSPQDANTSLGAMASVLHPDTDRSTWAATTPRNLGSKRQSVDISIMSNNRDESWTRTIASPSGRKRLSLLSDGLGPSYDRSVGASSVASKRDSIISDGNPAPTYRSPRFNYVSEKSGNSGPNESAASKRLSYISHSSAASAPRSPLIHQSQLGPMETPPHHSIATPSGSRTGARMSILGPNSVFGTPVRERDEVLDPQTLLGLKHRFEQMHLARRRSLCYLLALDFSMSDDSRDLEGYWEHARQAMTLLTELFDAQTAHVSSVVSHEMGAEFGSKTQGPAPAQSADLLQPPDADGRSSNLSGHLGLEDRFSAMALSLRSIQAKLRVCAEEAGVKRPGQMHGLQNDDNDDDDDDEAVPDSPGRLERMFDGIKDDLLSLSAEWEAGLKILKREKRASPSPSPLFEAVPTPAAARLDSPLEAEEDAVATDAEGGKVTELSLGDDDDDEEDKDIAALLLRSTSPQHLPPPGLEEVFESIAGMASFSRSKMSREERIRLGRSEPAAPAPAQPKDAADQAGMVSELSQVIRSRKQAMLGSPLDLQAAGVFEPHQSLPSGFDDEFIARPAPADDHSDTVSPSASTHADTSAPFDLGEQVAAFARRRAAQAGAVQDTTALGLE